VGIRSSVAAASVAWAALVAVVAVVAVVDCKTPTDSAPPIASDGGAATQALPGPLDGGPPPPPPRLVHRTAYIPPQCYAKTSRSDGDGRPARGTRAARNSCYVCHTASEAPNYVNDADLQIRLSLPVPAKESPWSNLVDPPVAQGDGLDDETVLARVRKSNYFDDDGKPVLARTLATLSPDWDGNRNGTWDGFTPDAWFSFDDRGFDRRPDGSLTGWRAFAYYPLPGAFSPANGSFDDSLVRLDPMFQEDTSGHFDLGVYVVNLAIVEALVRRVDVAIDPVDERALGADVDLDGSLGRATRVTFDGAQDGRGQTRMHYVGRAREEEKKGTLAIAPGLFPLGTEFLHTLRYLDVGADGVPIMAARMKEVRYARKVRWASYETSREIAIRDAREQDESVDGVHDVHWQKEFGVYNMRGWLLSGFIEASDGSLRPQTYEETAYCEGCHGGIGATVDNTFSFARKLGSEAPARGWYHGSQHDLRGVAEPKRRDGRYEYSLYLSEVGDGDDLRDNPEIEARFFDAEGHLRPDAEARLHADVSTLLLPSAARALDLDRAYLAIVAAQSFDRGRDAALAPSRRVYARAPLGELTGISTAMTEQRLAP
jgi:hypothetical protein